MSGYGRRAGEWLELPKPLPSDQEIGVWLSASFGLSPQELKTFATPGSIRVKGSKVLLYLFPEEESQFEPEWELPELELLFEDDFCLVVNKPAGSGSEGLSRGRSCGLLLGERSSKPNPTHPSLGCGYDGTGALCQELLCPATSG
ncbi:hypothetical protein [Gorillibacterium timonense]|uniref:hypothetical protein n=1 Tax=Gorillibacterium timonense TaxID=1689269 RepID=UPI00292A4690|nr:hypothetical protein [Gorillibacterium timonense]